MVNNQSGSWGLELIFLPQLESWARVHLAPASPQEVPDQTTPPPPAPLVSAPGGGAAGMLPG